MEPNPTRVLDKDHSKRKTMSSEGSSSNESTLSKTTFDQLAPAFVSLREEFATLNKQFKQLKKVDDSLTRFNGAFGAFLFGLSVNGTAVQWPKAPTKLDDEKLPTPQVAQVVRNPTSTTDRTNSNVVVDSKEVADSKEAADSKTAAVVNKINSGRVTKNKKIAKKNVNKINIRNIIEHLPLQYREQTEHMKTMETVLRTLRQKAEGMNMATMVKMTGLPQYRVTDCLNTLVRSKDVEKTNARGQPAIYKLDKVKYKVE